VFSSRFANGVRNSAFAAAERVLSCFVIGLNNTWMDMVSGCSLIVLP
jgi:hypothetical protein